MTSFAALPSATSGPLIGRANECKRIGELLDGATARGNALLIIGGPGIGKSALLNFAVEQALSGGFVVLAAAGIEFEADLTFSGLNQLLLPIADRISELPDPQRGVLEAALGQSTGTPTNTLAIATATLALLQLASARGPLLLVVDDFHWLDRASARVLAIVARRLEVARVALCCVVRRDEDDTLSAIGMPTLDLPPLDGASASQVLDGRFPVLAGRIRDRLLGEAQGNPLALLQLPAALTPQQRAARAAIPAVLPLTARLQEAFASRYRELPAGTRRILLLAALAGTDRLAVLFGGTFNERDIERLEAAEQARLVRLDLRNGSLAFVHPLTRAAVAGTASVTQARRAHLELARLEAHDPDRRTWHLAAAALEPDETVAAMLEGIGDRNLHRGDPANAVNALVRAGELSPDPASRNGRLSKAAYIGANITGDLASVGELLRDLRHANPDPSEALYTAAAAAVMLLNGDSEVATAHRILVQAIQGHAGDDHRDDDALTAALDALFLVCCLDGRVEAWEMYTSAVEQLTPALRREFFLTMTTFADPAYKAAAGLDELEEAIAHLDDDFDQWRTTKIAGAAVILDRLAGCRNALWELVNHNRHGEAAPLALTGLNMLTRDHLLSGDWNRADELCREGLKLADATGQSQLVFTLQEHRGILAALRGDFAEAADAIAVIRQWAILRGAWGAVFGADYVRTVLEMSRGDYEAAYQAATALSPAGAFRPYAPLALYVCMDLVESAARIGLTGKASSHVDALQTLKIGGLSSRLALLAGGAAALVAPSDRARELFEDALAPAETQRWPFDRARVQLNYGEHLRRSHGSTIDARHQLAQAVDTFTRLGARPWAARAAAELRAAGGGQSVASPKPAATLTPQEYEIATLAASGLTNKEIAKRVFLSDRTVGAHLYRSFPKLGITTRAGLRDALNALAAPQDPAPGSAEDARSRRVI